jgi:hypothetical protein
MSVRHCSGKLTMLFTKTDNAAMQRPPIWWPLRQSSHTISWSTFTHGSASDPAVSICRKAFRISLFSVSLKSAYSCLDRSPIDSRYCCSISCRTSQAIRSRRDIGF